MNYRSYRALDCVISAMVGVMSALIVLIVISLLFGCASGKSAYERKNPNRVHINTKKYEL